MSGLVKSHVPELAFYLVGAASAASSSARTEKLAAEAAPTRDSPAGSLPASNTSSAADNSSVVQPVVALIFGSPSITPPQRTARACTPGARLTGTVSCREEGCRQVEIS